jgi:hypothetical protein
MWNTLYLAVLKREPKHLSSCGACLDMDTSRNKSQIPWELVELSPTQRSEMDGSHCMSLLQFIRQTVNMLGIVWAIISIWDSFKIRVPYLLYVINAWKEKQKLQFKYIPLQTYIYTYFRINTGELFHKIIIIIIRFFLRFSISCPLYTAYFYINKFKYSSDHTKHTQEQHSQYWHK